LTDNETVWTHPIIKSHLYTSGFFKRTKCVESRRAVEPFIMSIISSPTQYLQGVRL